MSPAADIDATCPLCGALGCGPSWLGEVEYEEYRHAYLSCPDCGSLFCAPMPGPEELARMYGVEYASACHETYDTGESKSPAWVLAQLRRRRPGRFMDYGCGDGSLLRAAATCGWEAVGVEYASEVVENVRATTGARVVLAQGAELDNLRGTIDVLHLGDVVEHLVDAPRQLAEIISLLGDGGVLLAQGPLEANANVFTAVLRAARTLRRNGPVRMAPYHVLLATAEGQRRLFARVGLRSEEFSVSEVAWPAPAHLTPDVRRSPRAIALYALRRASMITSRLLPGQLGNRYRYAGVRER